MEVRKTEKKNRNVDNFFPLEQGYEKLCDRLSALRTVKNLRHKAESWGQMQE